MDEATRCHLAGATMTGSAIPMNPSALNWTDVSPAGMRVGWDGTRTGAQDQNWLAVAYWVQSRTGVPSRRSYLSASRHRRPDRANSG